MKTTNLLKTAAKMLTLSLTASSLIACGSFRDQTTSGSVETSVFDARFGDALEEVFETCADPLSIQPGDSTISLAGGCYYATEVASVNGQLVAGLLMSQGEVDLAEPIASEVGTIDETITGFPWPLQNCEVRVDGTIYFEGLNLYDLDARWTDRHEEAAFHIDFDFNGTQTVAEVDIDAVADCPSAINEWAIQKLLNANLNGRHDVRASDMDLDIWIPFFEESDRVATDLEVRFRVDSVNLSGVNWGALFLDADEMNEMFRSELQREADDIFEESLSDLPAVALQLLHYGIDGDAPVCSISQSGGELTVKTGDADARFPCVNRVITDAVIFGR